MLGTRYHISSFKMTKKRKQDQVGYKFKGKSGVKKARYKGRPAIPRALQGFVRTGGFYGTSATELKFKDVSVEQAPLAQNGAILEDSIFARYSAHSS